MKKIVLIFFVSFFILPVISQNKLSPNADISLLTCSKGHELYSAYGHSALRVKDLENNIDVVFNYGTFDYNTDNFLIKFIRGNLDYTLSTSPFQWFLETYKSEKRIVTEQIFDLTLAEKQAIFDRIIINYETDERYYRYDFFFDNCSSRIHEILKEVLGDSLIYGEDLNENSPETFRELIAPAFDFSPWADFGVGIIMGYPTDRIATNKEKMFLPIHMKERFEVATYKGKPFIKTTQNLNSVGKYLNLDISIWDVLKPIYVFSIFFIIVAFVTFKNLTKNTNSYWLDYILMFTTGLIGVFFLFMWFGTRHTPTFQNMNMFWAMPFNLIALFLIKSKKVKPYFLFMGILNILGFFILPEVFHLAILPIAFMMSLRYFKIYFSLKSL